MENCFFYISQMYEFLHRLGQTQTFHVGSMSALPVRRDKAALSSGCESHPANAPAGSNRSSYGGDEVAEAFG